MVIVEGVDGSGKTTLIKNLIADGLVDNVISKLFDPKYPHLLYGRLCDALHDYMDYPRVVADRFFISELVYGPILRGKLILSKAQISTILTLIQAQIPVVIIWCHPPLKTVKESLREPQMAGVVESIEKLYTGYEAIMPILFRGSFALQFEYDWTNPEAYSFLKNYLKGIQDEHQGL
jgi:GTPase SAR1 family protein